MSDLYQAISSATVETLKNNYCAFFGVKPKQTRKADLATALAQGLSDPVELNRHWGTLTDLEQSLVREAVYNYNGLVEQSRFTAKYGRFPENIRTDRFCGWSRKALPDAVQVFWYPQAERYTPEKIPDALCTDLRQLIDKPEADQLKAGTLPEPLPEHHKVFERQRQAVAELHALLILLQNKQIKVSEKTGLASSATMRKVSADIHEYYAEPSCEGSFGMECMVTYGWLRLLGNSPFCKQSKTTLVPAKKTGANPAETIKAIWDHWVKNRLHDEFRRIDNIKGQTGKGKRYFTDVVTRRQAIITALKECRGNGWVAFGDFSNHLLVTGAKLQVITDTRYLYIHEPSYGELYNAGWDILEARYLRCFLVEYTATLGLIDVVMAPPLDEESLLEEYVGYSGMECLSRYDGLQFLRLTPLGEYVLGLTDDYQSEETDSAETPLTLQRKGRIVFGKTPTPWEQQFITLYADHEKENAWKLSRMKIMETLQVGGSIEELTAFLQARDDQPFLPEDCEGMLKQAKANLDGVKIKGEALVVTCKNEAIAECVINDKTLSKWCQRLGDRQIVLPAGREKTFRKVLNSMGIGCS
ncbi:hypothetical protein GCM10023116_13510 [Kistimonas scapharcae]|uniref:Helicase XPB/Ssl2 N-terminal domain-containing protein n=1 Tax=Kistimonas scapharcae TaxID=1036133 RepID=A0ABP8UZK8_9GAMM